METAGAIEQYIRFPKSVIVLLLCGGIFLLPSCGFFQKKQTEKEEKPVARAFDKHLYASDLQGLVKPGTPAKDSLEIINNYIDSWIKKNLLLHIAEQNLTDEEKNIEKQLNDYRESLLIFLYEKAIVSQKLDTSVSRKEIEDYYEKYKMSFALKKNLVHIKYVIAKKESPKIDSVKYWLKLPSNENYQAKLNDFCAQYSVNYSLADEQWFSMDELAKQIPFRSDNQENYLKYLWADRDGNRLVELKDSARMYVANIRDYKIKGEAAPLTYVEDDIVKIIVNKRKLSLIKNVYEDIYQDAMRKGSFETYTK